MKKPINFLVLFTVITALCVYFSSCKKDKDTVEPMMGDKTALNTLIADCENLHDIAVEGTSVGNYEVGSKTEFKTAIDTAKTVANTDGATQSVIDTAKTNLEAAKIVFEGKLVPAGDKTALNALIAECETLHDNAVEGTSGGHYEPGSKAEFKTAIELAKEVANTENEVQSVIDAAKANLEAAKTVFESKFIQFVLTDGLVAQWLFDGDATDFTGNGNDGTAKTGHEFWGSGVPVLTTDRFGNADNAYYLDKGANIEVPYTTALNPAALSLSWWVYMEELDNSDYMISMSRWNCYKVCLQNINRVFFTTKVEDPANPGEYIYNDRDNDGNGLVENQWYHITVTFGGGHMIFYINGVMVKDWDDVTDAAILNISSDPVNLTIGQDLPTDLYANDDIHNVEWGGYFKGKLDDIRLYNRVLSGSEVTSIYNLEKP